MQILQHDPQYIPKMYLKFLDNKLDVVIGARKLTSEPR